MKCYIIEMHGQFLGYKNEFYKDIAAATRFDTIDEAWKVCNATIHGAATVRCLSEATMKQIDDQAVGI